MSALVIPNNINDLTPLIQVSFFHDDGYTIIPLHPPRQGKEKNGKTPISEKTKRLTNDEIYRFFGNGDKNNAGLSPKDGYIIINLDGRDHDRSYVERFLATTPELSKVPRVETARGCHLWFACGDLPAPIRQNGMVVLDIAEGLIFK
jgi:Bifunctional DNA primase/polymerase, N-terminal